MKPADGSRTAPAVELPDGFEPYQALELEPTAAQSEIEAVWERLSRDYDPDDYPDPGDRAEAEKTLAAARLAYELLNDAERRAQVDRLLGERAARRIKELVRKAEVVEHCFCLGLGKRFGMFGSMRPRGRRKTFEPDDGTIRFWAHIKLSEPLELRLEWIDPGGTVYRYMEDTVKPVSGRFFFTAWLYTHRLAKKGLFGTWTARLIGGGETLAEGTFVYSGEEER